MITKENIIMLSKKGRAIRQIYTPVIIGTTMSIGKSSTPSVYDGVYWNLYYDVKLKDIADQAKITYSVVCKNTQKTVHTSLAKASIPVSIKPGAEDTFIFSAFYDNNNRLNPLGSSTITIKAPKAPNLIEVSGLSLLAKEAISYQDQNDTSFQNVQFIQGTQASLAWDDVFHLEYPFETVSEFGIEMTLDRNLFNTKEIKYAVYRYTSNVNENPKNQFPGALNTDFSPISADWQCMKITERPYALIDMIPGKYHAFWIGAILNTPSKHIERGINKTELNENTILEKSQDLM